MHSLGKRVLNNLKTICLKFQKVVQTVAVIKFRVNNIAYVATGNGTGSFEVNQTGADTAKFDHECDCDNNIKTVFRMTE